MKECEFEGHKFFVPNDYEKHLESIYHNYLTFPTIGVEHHNYGRGALKTWAKQNNIDMNKIKNELQEILNNFD